MKGKLLLLLLFCHFLGHAQLAAVLDAEYLIVSKSEITQTIQSDRGNIVFDLSKSSLLINSRDQKKREQISTSNITIGLENISQIELKSFQHFNEVQIYNYILNPGAVDFGMRQLGFTSSFINKDEDGIFMDWKPTPNYEGVISKVLTKINGDKLDRVEYFNLEGELLCEIIVEEWGDEDLENTPTKIKTRYHINGVTHDRMIKLSHIKMLEL